MREIGNRTREIRRDADLSRREVAWRMDIDHVQLAAFEGGLVPQTDLPRWFPQRLGAVLSAALEGGEQAMDNPVPLGAPTRNSER